MTQERKDLFIGCYEEAAMLSCQNLTVFGDSYQRLSIPDPSRPVEEPRRGQFFVTMPERLAEALPGSAVGPAEFLNQMGTTLPDYAFHRLTGRYFGHEQNPALHLSEDNFTLRVFHGSSNDAVANISRLTLSDFRHPNTRLAYQKEVGRLISPCLNVYSPFQIRIVEDCIASGETIVGLLTCLHQRCPDLASQNVRVDVAVATSQGLLVLRRFSQENDIRMDVNVGNLAYGLSEGKSILGSKARQHANYIVYPELVWEELSSSLRQFLQVESQSGRNPVYVVGDMGDASQSLPCQFDDDCPWNACRTDNHGERGIVTEQASLSPIAVGRPATVYLANGGYLMRALKHTLCYPDHCQELMLTAKRVWSSDPKFGYGVLIDGVPESLLAKPMP